MSIREFALWSLAIGGIGPPPLTVDVVPPTSVPTSVTTPSAPTPAGPAPSSQSGQVWTVTTATYTMHHIARKFYGTPTAWRKIYDANRHGARRPGGLPPGWITTQNPDARLTPGRRLWIPR